MNSDIPTALKRSGIKRVSSNRKAGQELSLKQGALGLFFGDELAEALLAKQKRREQAHG